MEDVPLSRNFKLSEFIYSETALEKGIDNTPNEQVIENITLLVIKLLQPLRGLYGKPIVISSGYRSKELNRAVGGVYNSQHLIGQAADIRTTNPQELLALLKSSHLMFDQAITYKSKPHLLHLSYKATGNRNMILYRD